MSLCVSFCKLSNKKLSDQELSDEFLRNLNRYSEVFAQMVIINISHIVIETTKDIRYARKIALFVKEMGFKGKIKKYKNNNIKYYDIIAYNPVFR